MEVLNFESVAYIYSGKKVSGCGVLNVLGTCSGSVGGAVTRALTSYRCLR